MFNDANGYYLNRNDRVWINPYDIVSMDTSIMYRMHHNELRERYGIRGTMTDVISNPSENPAVLRATIVDFEITERGVDVTFDVYRRDSRVTPLMCNLDTHFTTPHLDMFHEYVRTTLSGVERDSILNSGTPDERARFTVSTSNHPGSNCEMFAHVNMWRGYANDVLFSGIDNDQTLNEEDAFMLCGWRYDMWREEGDSFRAFKRDFYIAVSDSLQGLSPRDAVRNISTARMTSIMRTLLSNRRTASEHFGLSRADANVVDVDAYDDENEGVVDSSIDKWYASLPA